MQSSLHRASQITVVALLLIVATQIFYVVASPLGITPPRDIVWGLEVLAFLAIAIFGLALVPARPIAGAAIGVGGIVNVIQAGMGLLMFGPLFEGGEALAPVATVVVDTAFLLYFAGKAAFAIAALAVGYDMWKSAGGARKIIGLLAVITGVIGLVLNLVMTFAGREFGIGGLGLMFPAGGVGTAATLFLALILTPSIDRATPPTSA